MTTITSKAAYDGAALHIASLATPQRLALELGHDDLGRAILNFIRFPDDGRGPFCANPLFDPGHLTSAQADRIRDRFGYWCV